MENLTKLASEKPGYIKRQQGAVIVVALFFVALVVTMSYVMMTRLERDTRRTSLLVRTTDAEFYMQGSILWAIEQLRVDLTKKKPDTIVDAIPLQSPVNEVNGYKISSKITDMQARLNLNNLTTPEAQNDFKQLIKLVAPQTDEQKINVLMSALADWMRQGQVQNEYNKYYMNLSPPYRAAHRLFVSASELRLVKGMTSELFNALQPYITALPVATKINVQTASAVVLATLSPGMNLDTGRAIEKARLQTKLTSTQVFLNLDNVKNHNPPPESKITVVSDYFLVETTATIEKQQVVLYTLLERSGNETKNAAKIIWQSKGLPN